jgi:hypothetical protein
MISIIVVSQAKNSWQDGDKWVLRLWRLNHVTLLMSIFGRKILLTDIYQAMCEKPNLG